MSSMRADSVRRIRELLPVISQSSAFFYRFAQQLLLALSASGKATTFGSSTEGSGAEDGQAILCRQK